MSGVLYLDLVGGLAGDMFVAACLDLGASLEGIAAGLEGLGFGPIRVSQEMVMRGALGARRFIVDGGDHDHDRPHDVQHESRCHLDISRAIMGAGLPDRVRDRALSVFAHLARAEGHVHGVHPDDVHFHEVGAVDSVADVVGACVALEQLGVDRIVAGAVPLGSGTVRTAHGLLPLPAPATLELLKGWPVRQAPFPGEAVTPTGAALLAALARPGPLPEMRLRAIGHGAGTRDGGPVPNVVRALLGDEAEPGLSESDRVEVLEAQVDDMPGEWWPPLAEALFGAGALDVFATQILMKKGRPGLLITALAHALEADAVGRALLRHSTSLGLRRSACTRQILPRRVDRVLTPWGEVRIKVGMLPGEADRGAPEYEDCARQARVAGVTIQEVYTAALRVWHGRTAAS